MISRLAQGMQHLHSPRYDGIQGQLHQGMQSRRLYAGQYFPPPSSLVEVCHRQAHEVGQFGPEAFVVHAGHKPVYAPKGATVVADKGDHNGTRQR